VVPPVIDSTPNGPGESVSCPWLFSPSYYPKAYCHGNEKTAEERLTASKNTLLVTVTEAPDTPHDITVTEVPESHDFGNDGLDDDINESAYQRALSSFSEDEKTKLTKEETIKLLYQQLNAADQGHEDQSLLRRGLKAVKPYLERLNATIDIISPFASMEPAAGTALGLVKDGGRLPDIYKAEPPPCLDSRAKVPFI
jgi:hypothetical protein